jgi:anthranilate phosphoribosyltransferase
MAKHGNRASTSASGSADLLLATDPSPRLDAVTPATLTALYERTNYAFLFAPAFHPAMRYVAPVRTQLGWRTIFNLLGPLAHPAHEAVEARVVGVARKDLGAAFAEALGRAGVRRAMVVCGDEDLDEISCAGLTHCWALGMDRRQSHDAAPEDTEKPRVDYFTLSPVDFGLLSFPLSAMTPGRTPHENAVTLGKILSNELPRDDPVLTFVLMNAAALLVVSGVCDAEVSAMGPGDDGVVEKERGPGWGRWKEGVRRARWAVESGAAVREWGLFVEATIAAGTVVPTAG